jgi:mRNA interferase MazF
MPQNPTEIVRAMMRRRRPSRGEIWIVDLNPTRGHETSGQRRALVISVNELDHGPAGLAMVLPVSNVDKHIATHVKVPAGEARQTQDGFVKCEEVRSLSIERFSSRVGVVKTTTLAAVMGNVRVLLGV